MAIIGILFFFVLSFLILNELNNKNKLIKIFEIIILCFLSGHFFINSMSFHYWLYPLVTGIFFCFFIFLKNLDLKLFLASNWFFSSNF